MRPTRFQWIAGVSAIVCGASLKAAHRPIYGGELRVEMRAEPDLTGQVYETLVRIDNRGDFEPWLATAWTHDTDRKQWVFTARANVKLHNGALWSPPGGAILVPDDKPIEQILRDLARPKNAVVVHNPDGTVSGTGPFRLAGFETGKSLRLEAHDDYWRGRPFLNAVEIHTGRSLREQSLDFDLKKTDVVEIEVTDVRRERQRGIDVQLSRPVDLVALVFENPEILLRIREAMALSIDRESILRVLLDKQGEATGALLPQWLTGYAFLFPDARDAARAKRALPSGAALGIAYDRGDIMMRSIADRIAVNAAEAGLVLRGGGSDVLLRRIPLPSLDARTDLEDLAEVLRQPLPSGSNYDIERALLADFRIIPLFHLPRAHALSANVRGWTVSSKWDDLWLE